MVSSETSVANGEIGVAVRHGAPKPDISTPAAVKRTLLNAKSIAFPDPENGTGASGVHTTKRSGDLESGSRLRRRPSSPRVAVAP